MPTTSGAPSRFGDPFAGAAMGGAPSFGAPSPMGLAAPSHLVDSDDHPFARAALPGSESLAFSTARLLEGHDPSLLTLDLVPLRPAGRDVPLGVPRASGAPPSSGSSPVGQASSPGAATPSAPHVGAPAAPQSASLDALPPGIDGTFAPRAGRGAEGHTDTPGLASTGRSRRIRDDFPILGQHVNGHRLVWLDSAATTQKPAAVIDAEAEFYRRDNSNVHRGAHSLARRATDAYEGAREKVQRFLGASSKDEIVFVRGTTEGINLVAQTYGRANVRAGDEILVSHLEHHSNIVPWLMLCEATGAVLRVAPVDDRGDLLVDAFLRLLNARTKVVALTHVSNVLGSVVPLAPLIAAAHERGAVVLVDGAQSVAHMPVDVRCLDVDFFVLSGHKLYAPTGIGAVYGKKALLDAMPPWQGGGNMIESVTFEHARYAPPPMKFEAGTGHIAGAVGLGVAIDYLEGLGRAQIAAHEEALMHYALDALRTVPGLRLLGAPRVRVGALPFMLGDRDPTEVAAALDRRGIAVRAGHHCAQPILRRFGLQASVRASLGVYNEPDDVDVLVDVLRQLARSS